MAVNSEISNLKLVSDNIEHTQDFLRNSLKRDIRVNPINKERFFSSITSKFIAKTAIVDAYYESGIECASSGTGENLSINIIRNNPIKFQCGKIEFETKAHDTVIYNTSLIDKSLFTPGTYSTFVSFNKKEVEIFIEKLIDRRVSISFEFGVVHRSASIAMEPIAKLVNILFGSLESDASSYSISLVRDALLMAVIEASPYYSRLIERPPARPASWQIRQALDFIAAQSRPVSVQDVADVAGIGVRALQMAFQEQLGISPHNYIKRARLEAVRSALKSLDVPGSVGDIARHWGFSNATRFSAEYEKAFGSKPSRWKSKC